MRTAGVLLLAAASALLGGCITTQKMPDGSTKVRITNAPSVTGSGSGPLGGLLPGATETSQGLVGVDGVVGADGVVSLIPKTNPLPNGPLMYLNGQFAYSCMSELLYAAKSGANRLRERVDSICRTRYLVRQSELKRAGKPYDTSAPRATSAEAAAYWQSLVERNIAALRGANRFAVRVKQIAHINKTTGMLSVRPGLAGRVDGDPVNMVTVPADVPVVADDAELVNHLKTRGGGFIICGAIWEFLRIVDHNTGNAGGRFEMQFKAAQMECSPA